jgi:hypothetical protein
MIYRLTCALLFVFLVATQIVTGQETKRFDPKSYPAGSFHVTRHDYPHGNFTVRIILAKRVYEVSAPPPSYCRAWLEVRGGGMILRQAFFDDIDPVGSDYGIFVPEHQPFEEYFVALKEGDYDGRLLLVGKDGSLTNLPGGGFFLTTDKRYLIGEHASDYASLIVLDVARRQIVIDGGKDKLPGVGDWYLDKAGYFFTEDEETGQPKDSSQKTVAIYRLDLKRLKVTRDVITSAQLRSARKIEYEPWQKPADCTSEH